MRADDLPQASPDAIANDGAADALRGHKPGAKVWFACNHEGAEDEGPTTVREAFGLYPRKVSRAHQPLGF